MTKQRQADLITEIGEKLVEDPASMALDWDLIACVATFEQGSSELLAYAFTRSGEHEVLMPEDVFGLLDIVEDLRNEMIADGEHGWLQALMTIARPEYKFSIVFEHDEPDRWEASDIIKDMSQKAKELSNA